MVGPCRCMVFVWLNNFVPKTKKELNAYKILVNKKLLNKSIFIILISGFLYADGVDDLKTGNLNRTAVLEFKSFI